MNNIKKGYVDTSDGQVHYRALNGGFGPPIVLFHMTASTSESYESLMLALGEQAPTIAIDTPGYGESFKPTKEPSIEYVSDIVIEALDAMGVDRFHVFGHHTGASIALELACAHPERTISATLNGICSLGQPEEGEAVRAAQCYPNPPAPLGESMLNGWARVTKGLEVPGLSLPDELLHRELVAYLKAGEDWSWAYRAVFCYDAEAKLNAVTRPIWFVAAEHDGIMPFHIREVERHPEYPSYIPKGYGVFYSELAPDDLAPKLLDFVRESERHV